MRARKGVLLITGVALVLFGAVVYASSLDYLSQAQKYINQNCSKQKLSNQTATLCYLFNKSQEQDASIASLKNSTGKTLHVLDANNQDLGILINRNSINTTVYSTSLQKFIYLEISNDTSISGHSIDGQFAATGATYQSSDCTGAPYLSVTDIINGSLNSIMVPGIWTSR